MNREQPPHTSDETDEQTILVVDDDPSALKIINACLKESGYRTAIATSGKIALERKESRISSSVFAGWKD